MLESNGNGTKKVLIEAIVNSGFNISPDLLDLIVKLPDPKKKIRKIFKKSTSISDSNSHLTKKLLKKIIYKNQNFFTRNTIETLTNKQDKIQTPKKILKQNINTNVKTEKLHNPIFPKNSRGESNYISKIQEKPVLITNLSENFNKKKTKKSIYQRAKSSLSFKPVAKDYASEYKILKDPSGKIYTTGEYDDFYNLTMSKYEKLKSLMQNRPEVHSASNIKNILRISGQIDISAIGLVKNIRKTKKGNYFLDLEDHTGEVGVLISKNLENEPEFKNLIEKIIEDQLIYIQGQYNPNKNQKHGIIYASYFTKIDLPTDFTPNHALDNLSIALLSDLHIGSKEFEEKLFLKFIKFLKGEYGNSKLRSLAGKIKYIVINGDLIDGIGVYPNQKEDLNINDIYKQYQYCSDLICQIPEYITIIYSPGNHEPVRNAIPRPAVPKKYSNHLRELEVECIGNPCLIQTHGVNTLVFHGDSMLDLNLLIPSFQNDNPIDTMKELLICRHLAPVFGKKTQIAPIEKDWLVIDKIPDIFHTGHLHINGLGSYRNVTLVNSGCFQSQTTFMKSFGINPTPGIVPIINLANYEKTVLDFKKLA